MQVGQYPLPQVIRFFLLLLQKRGLIGESEGSDDISIFKEVQFYLVRLGLRVYKFSLCTN